MGTLSWSLFRRTPFNFRVAFSASSIKSLVSQIEDAVKKVETGHESLGVRVDLKAPREIMGVFTGQGAQWATMGRKLILTSRFAESVIDELEKSLTDLPDAPEWSLKAEMLAAKEKSRIAEGVISQPVCTAVQIMLVKVLQKAGICFNAVVGHSSGEIACAYVAGFLSARDAIRIAFYRGKFTPLAKGGAMIAAGTDMQDAIDLCSLPKLNGKAQLAASNSSASVTISGDADAIDLVEMVMKDESKFARKLKVDTAYHSFHMRISSGPYIESLNKCGIQVYEPIPHSCPWYSSVTSRNERVTMDLASTLKSLYWRDNMLQPVLFSQAVKSAVSTSGAPGVVIEIGPHAALKGPASMTVQDVSGSPVPYFGTLSRGQDDALAVAETIGSLWTILGGSDIDLKSFELIFTSISTFEISKSLPTYAWDHEMPIWNETRVSKASRFRADAKHELLGIRAIDEFEGEMRWRNWLKLKEMPWLKGHQIQGQTVFPAAGYIAMALEAARHLAPYENIRTMELEGFKIHKALSFLDENAGIEIMFSLSKTRNAEGFVTADFAGYAFLNKDVGKFTCTVSGRAKVTLGEPSHDAMPERPKAANSFIDTDPNYFYSSLADLGYGYTGMFDGINHLQRTNGMAKGNLTIAPDENSAPQNWIIHPASLDIASQGIFAAVGAPGDGRLWTMHLPTMIDSVMVNPRASEENDGIDDPLPFESNVAVFNRDDGLVGDVDIYDKDGKYVVIQCQGLRMQPVTKASAADDRETFAAIEWGPASPDLAANWTACMLTDDEEKEARFAERLSLFVLRDLCDSAPAEKVRKDGTDHQCGLLDWARQIVKAVRVGKHPTCPRAWLADTWELLKYPAERLSHSNGQIHLCLWVKERLLSFVSGEVSVEEEVKTSQAMNDQYSSIPYHQLYIERLGDFVRQISFKHRNLKVLEIGSGKGSTTQTILSELGDNFTSYTCTDIETTYFEEIIARFTDEQTTKIIFKTLDIEQDPAEQGFNAGHFDLIVASNALHRTLDLDHTLRNARSLLRPGGYLTVLEMTGSDSLAISLGACMRPTWFAGIEASRTHLPLASQKIWDAALREAGFSGVETATPDEFTFAIPFSIMCSIAVNEEMEKVLHPLDHAGEESLNANLLIVGGKTLATNLLVRDLEKDLAPFFNEIITAESVSEVDEATIATKPTALSLAELDEPVFRPFTKEKYKALATLFDNLQSILWITAGARGQNPYLNMMSAVGRCLEGEMPHLRLQFLDFDPSDKATSALIAHHLLRLHSTYNFSGEVNKIGEPLYTIERELSIQNGTLFVPRYLHVHDINVRLNSDRRLITHDVDQRDTAVELDVSSTQYKLLQREQCIVEENLVKVKVGKAMLNAIKIGGAGCFHVITGATDSGKKMVALSDSNQSIVAVPQSHAVEIDVEDGDEASLLLNVTAELLAASILSGTYGSVHVHEPTAALATALRLQAEATNRMLILTSMSSNLSGATRIDPSFPDRVLERLIPQDTTVLADLSDTANASYMGARFGALLSTGCQIKNTSHLYSKKAFRINETDLDALRNAVERASPSTGKPTQELNIIPASAMLSQKFQHPGLQIIDWEADNALPVAVVPADELMQFRSDRTYFLVGLAGELGLQMVKWMVLRGARYLALSSRNPNVPQEWLELVRSRGATLNLYAMDVTDRASVQVTHQKVVADMPPVAGVMNGAMVLIDALFANNTHADFEKTLRPKVDGTVYLDEIFGTTDLDFFIVFSSLAAVSGNVGQSAYAAANAFMCSLIAGRRTRGLAGSAINMPGIIGLGYLNRASTKLDRLKKIGYVNISEWEFFQFLSEAIVAGRPNSGKNPEITAGLHRSDVQRVGDDAPLWYRNPRFHTLRRITAGGAVADGEESDASIRSQLAEMTDESSVLKLLLEGFIDNLCKSMSADRRSVTPNTAIVQLGVDSLLAVDMRAWFTRELDLDMPVLKILGGATVQELVEDAVGRLSSELVPRLSRAAGNAGTAAEQVSEEQPVPAEEGTIEANTESGQDSYSVPIEDIQSVGELDEEPLTMVPLDLPSYLQPVRDPLTVAKTINSGLREPSADSSRLSSSPAYECEDTDDYSATTFTSNLEAGRDDRGSRSKSVIELSGDTKTAASPTKLFSHVSNETESNAGYVKKVRMSYGTSRFWFLMQYLQDPTTFNLMTHFKLTGPINYEDADRCVTELGNRHEVFRSAFFANSENANEPMMGVFEKSSLRMERRRALSDADVDAEKDELLNYRFKLEQGETARVKLISISDKLHHVLFAFHHIAMDGFSFNVLLADINRLYDRQTPNSIGMQFSDFATLQHQQVTDGTLDKEFQFWKNMYSAKLPSGEIKPDFPEPLPLFNLAQSPRKSLDTYVLEETGQTLDRRTVQQIKAQCRRHKITTFHFLLAAYRTFLFRHLDVNDLVIGIADANRTDNSLDNTIGFMLNLLPLRFTKQEGDEDVSFKDVVLDARNTAYNGLANSKIPFDALLEKLDMPRSTTHSPLFQAWMDYRPFRTDYKPSMFGAETSGTASVGRTGYDITLEVDEVNSSDIQVNFRAQSYLYSAKSTKILFESFMRLVKAFAANFETKVSVPSLWHEEDVAAAKSLGLGKFFGDTFSRNQPLGVIC